MAFLLDFFFSYCVQVWIEKHPYSQILMCQKLSLGELFDWETLFKKIWYSFCIQNDYLLKVE